jgi:hypothetical protein
MFRGTTVALAAVALVAMAAGRLLAQMPKVGDLAPDFALKGSTREGLRQIHLADFRGQTVVLAFFPKARTKG